MWVWLMYTSFDHWRFSQLSNSWRIPLSEEFLRFVSKQLIRVISRSTEFEINQSLENNIDQLHFLEFLNFAINVQFSKKQMIC